MGWTRGKEDGTHGTMEEIYHSFEKMKAEGPADYVVLFITHSGDTLQYNLTIEKITDN